MAGPGSPRGNAFRLMTQTRAAAAARNAVRKIADSPRIAVAAASARGEGPANSLSLSWLNECEIDARWMRERWNGMSSIARVPRATVSGSGGLLADFCDRKSRDARFEAIADRRSPKTVGRSSIGKVETYPSDIRLYVCSIIASSLSVSRLKTRFGVSRGEPSDGSFIARFGYFLLSVRSRDCRDNPRVNPSSNRNSRSRSRVVKEKYLLGSDAAAMLSSAWTKRVTAHRRRRTIVVYRVKCTISISIREQ